MTFLPYENVPLYLSVSGKDDGEYVFAEKASISLGQDVTVSRQIDDNLLQICAYGDGSNVNYQSKTFTEGESFLVMLGSIDGPARPLATSIDYIHKDTQITFPNGKHLYFSKQCRPSGHDYVVSLYAKSGGWSLDESECQDGFFEPDYKYHSTGPVEGTLNVDFYLNTGNLPSFFNITGLVDPTIYPPVSNESITGFLGDFAFTNAYLSSFSFGVSANSISQASASFKLYGLLRKDTELSKNYYSSDLYKQQSVPHGDRSKIIGVQALGMDHVTSFTYSAQVNRYAKYSAPKTDIFPEFGFLPDSVSKRETQISISVEGTNIDPSILKKASNEESVNLTCELHDLSYDNYKNNSAGLMQTFNCNGPVDSQSISVNSLGYLNGSFTITKYIQ